MRLAMSVREDKADVGAGRPDFRVWPLAEGRLSACHVGCQGQTGRRSNLASTAAFDPKQKYRLAAANLGSTIKRSARRTAPGSVTMRPVAGAQHALQIVGRSPRPALRMATGLDRGPLLR